MIVLVVVAGAAALVGAATFVSTRLRPNRDIAAPHTAVRRVAKWLIRHPRLLGWVERHLDSRAAAGVALTALLVIGVIGFAVMGALFALLRTGSTVARIDDRLARWGAANATEFVGDAMRFLTRFGATETVIVLGLGLVGWEVWRGRGKSVLLYLTTVIGGVTLITNVVKILVDRDRPAILVLGNWAGASFPSGHSATGAAAWAAFAVVVGRHRSRLTKAAAAAVAATIATLVACSRIFLGVHWLSDVLAGVAVGWGWFALSTIAFGGRLLRLGAPVEAAERVDALEHGGVPAESRLGVN